MGRHLQWKERRNSKGLLSLHWGFVVVQPPPNHKQPLLTPPCKRLIQFQECVIIPSILMYSSFQSCDCLQSTFGMLCYSIRTPQDIFEALARASLSIFISATFLGEKSWALGAWKTSAVRYSMDLCCCMGPVGQATSTNQVSSLRATSQHHTPCYAIHSHLKVCKVLQPHLYHQATLPAFPFQ